MIKLSTSNTAASYANTTMAGTAALSRTSALDLTPAQLAAASEVLVKFPSGDAVPMDARVESFGAEGNLVVLSVGHTGGGVPSWGARPGH